MKKRYLKAFERALEEGRLGFVATDVTGHDLATQARLKLGKWTHFEGGIDISIPFFPRGRRVWLVEGKGAGRIGRWQRIRPLAEVYPDECIDPRLVLITSGQEIMDVDLSGVSIGPVYLEGSRLLACNFDRSILQNVILDQCSIMESSFRKAEIWTSASLSAWHGCDMRESAFIVDAPYSNFFNSDFRKATMRECDFSGSLFTRCDFREADLRGAFLHNASFEECIFEDADLKEAYRPEGGIPGWRPDSLGYLVRNK